MQLFEKSLSLFKRQKMNPIVIQPRNKKESDKVLKLLNQMGIRSGRVSRSSLEDAGLTALMNKVDRKDRATEESVMKKLIS